MEEQIIRTEYSDLMQKSYIDYAMSVIIARALPDVRDGLKPVQRRTLYDMYDTGAFPVGAVKADAELVHIIEGSSLYGLKSDRKSVV